jgi:hypothetical protein
VLSESYKNQCRKWAKDEEAVLWKAGCRTQWQSPNGSFQYMHSARLLGGAGTEEGGRVWKTVKVSQRREEKQNINESEIGGRQREI